MVLVNLLFYLYRCNLSRGDLLLVKGGASEVRIGDVIVYKIENRENPIVHRVIEVRADRIIIDSSL